MTSAMIRPGRPDLLHRSGRAVAIRRRRWLVYFEQLRHHRESHRQRAPEHFVGGFLDGSFEMSPDPLRNKIVGDGGLQAVVFEVKPCRVVEPDMESLRSDALRDGVRQP